MTIIKNTTAFDYLYDFVENRECDGKIERLLNEIADYEKIDVFNSYVDDQFPNGTDEDEYLEFFRKNVDKILDECGCID